MFDVYETVTAKIIEQIEAGAGKWRMPWHSEGMDMPVSADGRNYRGINVFLLWGAATAKGYESNIWATYKTWTAKKAQVRKGEKGTLVIFWSRIEDKKFAREHPGSDPKMIMFAKAYSVFNAAQVDGYEAPAKPIRIPLTPGERIESAEKFFAAIPATVLHGGGRAFYSQAGDYIGMPDFNAFNSPEDYYSTRAHESIHWTAGNKRVPDREFGKRFGDSAYAFEELVAELGAAFVCADLGISNEPRPDHAQYLSLWLSVLKADKRAIFTAASRAQAAADYLAKTAHAAAHHFADCDLALAA